VSSVQTLVFFSSSLISSFFVVVLGAYFDMGGGSSKVDPLQSVRAVEAKTYEELASQVESIAFLASHYSSSENHYHLTFRLEPRKDQLDMPAAFFRHVFIIITTVPDLPEFWECRLAPDGRVYYVNHANRTTQWSPPWNIPYAPILAQPPFNMIKKLSYYQWSIAYSSIQEAIGDPIAIALRVKREAAAAAAAEQAEIVLPVEGAGGDGLDAPADEDDEFESQMDANDADDERSSDSHHIKNINIDILDNIVCPVTPNITTIKNYDTEALFNWVTIILITSSFLLAIVFNDFGTVSINIY